MKITSDNRRAEKLLKKIVHLIIKNGGHVDEHLEIRCHNDEISVHAPPNADIATLIAVPHELLLPFNAFEIQVNGNKFILEGVNSDVTALQKTLMKTMLALYNATNKLEHHRAHSPWHTHRNNKPLINILTQCRFGEEFAQMRDMTENGDQDALAKLTFFKTRILTCRLHKKWGQQTDVLLPLIDCFNHHVVGAPFKHVYSDSGAMLSIASKQSANSDECYLSYGRMDAMDTYLHYGFVDESAPFVRSVPMVIDLEDAGKLHIQASYGKVGAKELPEALKDLLFFMPAISIDSQTHQAQLSHLLIPEKNGIFSMRRILAYAIRALNRDMADHDIAQHVVSAEKLILENNVKLYAGIVAAAQGSETPQLRQQMIDFVVIQQKKIQNYANALNNAQKQQGV